MVAGGNTKLAVHLLVLDARGAMVADGNTKLAVHHHLALDADRAGDLIWGEIVFLRASSTASSGAPSWR